MNLDAGERALKYFEHALRIEPDSVAAVYGKAQIYQKYKIVEDNESRAIELYQ